MAIHNLTIDGVILKRKNVGDHDRVVTLLTPEYGKLSILVKGSRHVPSKRAAYLETSSYVRVQLYKSRNWWYLQEVTSIILFYDSFVTLAQTVAATTLLEMADILIPQESGDHRGVLEVVVQALQNIREHNTSSTIEAGTVLAMHRLLHLLGYSTPQLQMSYPEMIAYVSSISEREFRSQLVFEQTFR